MVNKRNKLDKPAAGSGITLEQKQKRRKYFSDRIRKMQNVMFSLCFSVHRRRGGQNAGPPSPSPPSPSHTHSHPLRHPHPTPSLPCPQPSPAALSNPTCPPAPTLSHHPFPTTPYLCPIPAHLLAPPPPSPHPVTNLA